MIHFQCPKCRKKLGVKEEQAGGVGVCPECQCKFRIPAMPNTGEPASLPPRRSEPGRQEDGPARPVRKRKRVEDDDDQPPDDDEADRKRARKRGKKRRKRAASPSSGMPEFVVPLISLVVVALLFFGLALIWPVAALLPIGIGWLLSAVGGIWFLIVAFEDSAASGLLCLFVPFYGLYHLITHFDEEQRPFFLQLAGFLLVMTGTCAGAFSAQRDKPAPKFRAENPVPIAALATTKFAREWHAGGNY
jgi:hypothetical protein